MYSHKDQKGKGNPQKPMTDAEEQQCLAAGVQLHSLSKGGTYNPYTNQPMTPGFNSQGETFHGKTIETPLGLVGKISLNQPNPAGWRTMTLDEGKGIKDHLNKLMSQWSIVGFTQGKFDGPGYGSQFHSNYGSECGEKFVVKNNY